jgi:hypothetical protein
MRPLSLAAILIFAISSIAAERNIVRSAKGGAWEAADTWGRQQDPGGWR